MFKTRVKEARKRKGLTQKQLATYLNLSANAICEWEKGRSEPSFDTLKKIADYFGVSVNYLLGFDECNFDKKITSLQENTLNISQVIKTLRTEHKLTQKQLAEKIGSSAKNIWAYENGFSNPPLEACVKLANIFGVSIDYLVGRECNTEIAINNDKKELLAFYEKLSQSEQKVIKETVRQIVISKNKKGED